MRVAVVLVVVFALASVVGLYTLATIDATPSSTTTTGSLLSYETTTAFDYRASLKPNVLYNTTSLGPGQGTLYESLVTELNMSFDYWLNLSTPADVTFGGGFELVLSAVGQWNYTLAFSVGNRPIASGVTSYNFSDSTDLQLAPLYGLIGNITNETGVADGAYALRFTAVEVARIFVDGQSTEAYTIPFLNFTLGSGVIVPGPLVATSSGGIPTSVSAANTSRGNNLDIALAVVVALLAGLAVAVYFTVRPRTKRPDIQADLDSLTAPYADAIATTWTAPRKENVVVLRDWQDLVRVADMLGKPILRYVFRRREPTRYFYYVLDDAIQYIYLVPRDGRPAEEDLDDVS